MKILSGLYEMRRVGWVLRLEGLVGGVWVKRRSLKLKGRRDGKRDDVARPDADVLRGEGGTLIA